MNARVLRLVTLAVVLGAGFVANPPPGELLGREVGVLSWSAIAGAALVGGLVTVVAAGRSWAYPLLAPLALFVMGPVHTFASPGSFAVAVAAIAFLLHIELMTFERRRARWSASMVATDDGPLAQYERAYARAVASLAAVLVVAFAAILGAFRLLLAAAPASLARSVEASHVEGLASALLVAALFILAITLLFRRPARAGNEAGEAPTEAAP